jgi:predicted permease
MGRRAGVLDDFAAGLRDLAVDLRYSMRTPVKTPQFTAMAVLILGLGIGANTAIFSVVDAVYFDAPPHVAAPNDLVRLGGVATGSSGLGSLSYPDLAHYRENQNALVDLAGWGSGSAGMALTVGRSGERTAGTGLFVSDNYFDVLGTRPAVGRWFLPEEDRTEGTHLVAVISHGFWSRAFGADPGVVGETVEVNGSPFTVVGVAPEGFRGTSAVVVPPDVWVPFHSQPVLAPRYFSMLQREEGRGWNWVHGIGRLRTGVTLEAAQDEMDGLSLYLQGNFAEWSSSDVRLDAGLTRSGEGTLNAMIRLPMVAVAAVLLVASANIAILLLARGSVRSREVAVRMAVGAGRGRIVRAALTESLVLALLGALLGTGLAYLMSGLVAGVLPATFSVSFEPDVTALAFACVLALGTALLFGLLPALKTSRVDVNRTLKGDEGGADRSRLPGGLVVAQVAVAVSLATAAALTARSFATANAVPLGYELEDRVLVSTTLSEQGYAEEEGQIFVQRALEGLRAVPGVRSVSTLGRVPFYGGYYSEGFSGPGDSDGERLNMGINTVMACPQMGNHFLCYRLMHRRSKKLGILRNQGDGFIISGAGGRPL